MKKKEVKMIQKKLIVAVKKALTDNNDSMIAKIEKDFKRSIRTIAKKKKKKEVPVPVAVA